ncbi:DNA-binding transcriptional regulator, MerR family [Natronincola peptidivorans]|uniref:DNA-binding transcriptional regulator, MerR family n=1 Tax=Natronincola peptidivorans TaxID=426128 RepID=A0A1I0DPA0_9FIRM|nr:MerR family transcriptional regulator [Natronincola peptidivorans]SET34372.1 DNA-binding transcriptional regulator, MerR family [Natronincola peptidivorans]
MEYTVQQLAQIAGVSSRTLRYYDEIELLKPARINSSGYRIYGKTEVDRLQQILFYRELGVSLEGIKDIITDPNFDALAALAEHQKKLLEKRMQLDLLIKNVERTIASRERSIVMNDKEKFEGFKKKLIDDNEKKYGKEVREKYGEEAVNRSKEAFRNLSKEEYEKMVELEKQIKSKLAEAYKDGNPASDLAQETARLHKDWISMCWGYYNAEAHRSLAEMYVADERFAAYYDAEQTGAAEFLRDAIVIYTKGKKS